MSRRSFFTSVVSRYLSTAKALEIVPRCWESSPVSRLNDKFCKLNEFFSDWAASTAFCRIFVSEHRGLIGSLGFLKDKRRFTLKVRSVGSHKLVVPSKFVKPLSV